MPRRLELHVWGPAFGLPSFDPECLAAIAYLGRALERTQWTAVPSSNPAISPWGVLPVLRVEDGEGDDDGLGLWVSGFSGIVEYLQETDGAQNGDLDVELDGKAKADVTARGEWVKSQAGALLDLSLFVSSENYTGVTRGLLSEMTGWPASWSVPGRLRDGARKRTEHLGLTELDVDVAASEEAKKENQVHGGLNAQIPERLRRPGKTVRGLLGQAKGGSQFRLAALTDGVLEGLEEMMGGKRWMFGPKPSSLDCLIVGYLAVMKRAELPQDWLRTALQERYPGLDRWIADKVNEMFGAEVAMTGGQVVALEGRSMPPWKSPAERTWVRLASDLLESFTASLPVIGPAYLHPQLPSTSAEKGSKGRQRQQRALLRIRNQHLFLGKVIASCLGVATATGLLFWMDLLHLPPLRRLPRPSRREFGAAGAMLGLG